MKILHVITSLNKGGAENHLFRLATIQAQKKNDVKIIFFKGNSYWKKYLKKNKVNSIKFSLFNNYNLIQIFIILFKILKLIRKEKPDIVHAHLALPEILIFLFKF